jgi:hypothetical protein
MSWGVFPDGRTGLSSLLDPLLEFSSLDPLWSLLVLVRVCVCVSAVSVSRLCPVLYVLCPVDYENTLNLLLSK